LTSYLQAPGMPEKDGRRRAAPQSLGFMVSLSNHEAHTQADRANRFMVRQAHHEAIALPASL